jgi:hypothetical protein
LILKKKLQPLTIDWFLTNKEKLKYSVNKLYKEIGTSKEAVSQYTKRQKVFEYNVRNLIVEAEELRK